MKKAKLILTIVILILLDIGFFWLRGVVKASHLTLEADQEIDMTPTQIQSIKAIGEWEFLSVSAEELVDTVRKGFIRNDELARIYYGTLRLGVNIRQVPAVWIESRGDTIIMTLPKVKLLDKDFIDEARTKPFYESGTWRPADHEILYKKAYRMMTQHCLTKENLQAAEENGRQQFTSLLKSMGYKNVSIKFVYGVAE